MSENQTPNPNPNENASDAVELARKLIREKATQGVKAKSLKSSEIDLFKIPLPHIDQIYNDASSDPYCVLAPLSRKVYTFEPIDPMLTMIATGDQRQLTHLAALAADRDPTLDSKTQDEVENILEEDAIFQRRVVCLAVNGLFAMQDQEPVRVPIKIVDNPSGKFAPENSEYPVDKIPPFDLRVMCEAIMEISAPAGDQLLIHSFRRLSKIKAWETTTSQGLPESEGFQQRTDTDNEDSAQA